MPGKKAIKKSRGQKIEQWSALQEACKTYNKVLFVDVDNVTSKQICIMRRQLRAIDSLMFMGKNVSFDTLKVQLNLNGLRDDRLT